MALDRPSVTQLKAWLDSDETGPLILDVREPWEFQLCRREPSIHIPMRQIPGQLAGLDRKRDIVMLCHHGSRSLQICRFRAQYGFDRLFNVTRGIDA